jgi:hypothetical protein
VAAGVQGAQGTEGDAEARRQDLGVHQQLVVEIEGAL